MLWEWQLLLLLRHLILLSHIPSCLPHFAAFRSSISELRVNCVCSILRLKALFSWLSHLGYIYLTSLTLLSTHFLDTIKGLATYRAFGWTADGIQVNDVLLDTSQRPTYLLAIVQRWLLFSLQTVVTLLAIAVVAMATQMRSSTALTGAGIITLMTFGDILNYIIRWFTQLETSIGAVSRIKSFSENVVPETAESENQIPPEEWPSSGHIELRNVSASYKYILDWIAYQLHGYFTDKYPVRTLIMMKPILISTVFLKT